MKKSFKLFFASLLAVSIFVLLTACGGAETKKPDTGDNSKASSPGAAKPSEDKPKEEAKTDVAAADEIGVPECDEYVKKYEACVFDKVPEAMRGPLKSSFETARKQWKEAAANPQTKGTLASACKQAHDAAKQSMASYKCDW